jgi:hypothetical protein
MADNALLFIRTAVIVVGGLGLAVILGLTLAELVRVMS